MEAIGLGLTFEEINLISTSLGACALSFLSNGKTEEDYKRAMKLHRLHGKFIKMIEDFRESQMQDALMNESEECGN